MREKRFLYRRRDDDDRDACAYIENPDRWECGHDFGGLYPQGSCFSVGEDLLEEEYYVELHDGRIVCLSY